MLSASADILHAMFGQGGSAIACSTNLPFLTPLDATVDSETGQQNR